MSVDLTKLTLYSPDNAFKNVNRYAGSITFPTSVASGGTLSPTTVVTLTDTPVFTAFHCNFLEYFDAFNATGIAHWYNTAAVSYQEAPSIAITILTPAPHVGEIGACTIYPVINGSTVTVTGYYHNPYAVALTFAPLTIPFVFVEYTLAN